MWPTETPGRTTGQWKAARTTLSFSEGIINVTLTNTDLENDAEITVAIAADGKPEVAGEILTSRNIGDYNSFENSEVVKPVQFKDFKVKDGKITVKMPAKSIVSLSIR